MDQSSAPDTGMSSRLPNQSAEEYLETLLTLEQKEYLDLNPEDREHLVKHPEDLHFLEAMIQRQKRKPLPMPPEMMERLNDAAEAIRLRRQIDEYKKKQG